MQSIESLDDKVDEVDTEIQILAHAKTAILEAMVSRIEREHGDDLRDIYGVEDVEFDVSHSPESATYKSLKIRLVPQESRDEFPGDVDKWTRIREFYHDRVTNIIDYHNMHVSAYTSVDWHVTEDIDDD